MFNQVYLKNVSTLTLNQEKCDGCQMCVKVCPHEVLKIRNKKAIIFNLDACMECGACFVNCPQEAIFVNIGVGCAEAIINGLIYDGDPECGCCDDNPKRDNKVITIIKKITRMGNKNQQPQQQSNLSECCSTKDKPKSNCRG